MTGTKRVLCALFAAFFASSAAGAIEIETGTEELTLDLSPLIQPRVQVDFDGPSGAAAPSGGPNFDIFIYRARLLARGTAYRQFTFGINFVALRVGQRGNYNVSPFVQDARVGYTPAQNVDLELGLLLMPLTRTGLQAAALTSTLDTPGAILLYNKAGNLRETGIQLRALLLDRRILVRGGFYEGARNSSTTPGPALNPDGLPLVGGMIRLNLVGDEPGYSYPGIYLDGSTHVSIGVGGQYQPHSGGLRPNATSYDDYVALAADFFADLALAGGMEAIFSLGGYRYRYGPGNARTGNGMQGEIGYRWASVEAQGNFYWFNSDTKKDSSLKVGGGVNVFLRGHEAKIHTELARVLATGSLTTTPPTYQVVVQTQLMF